MSSRITDLFSVMTAVMVVSMVAGCKLALSVVPLADSESHQSEALVLASQPARAPKQLP